MVRLRKGAEHFNSPVPWNPEITVPLGQLKSKVGHMLSIGLGSFLFALATVIDTVLWMYFWIVVVAAFITWVNPDPYNPIVRFLRAATEPAFSFVRQKLPVRTATFDFSPIVVLLAIHFLRVFFNTMLLRIASTL
jgi:YggT family protein